MAGLEPILGTLPCAWEGALEDPCRTPAVAGLLAELAAAAAAAAATAGGWPLKIARSMSAGVWVPIACCGSAGKLGVKLGRQATPLPLPLPPPLSPAAAVPPVGPLATAGRPTSPAGGPNSAPAGSPAAAAGTPAAKLRGEGTGGATPSPAPAAAPGPVMSPGSCR